MVDPPVIKRGNEQIPVQMEVLMGKPTVYGGCSIAMFDYRRVPKSQNEFHQYGESLGQTMSISGPKFEILEAKTWKITSKKRSLS